MRYEDKSFLKLKLANLLKSIQKLNNEQPRSFNGEDIGL
jgi:hypothetical protein